MCLLGCLGGMHVRVLCACMCVCVLRGVVTQRMCCSIQAHECGNYGETCLLSPTSALTSQYSAFLHEGNMDGENTAAELQKNTTQVGKS